VCLLVREERLKGMARAKRRAEEKPAKSESKRVAEQDSGFSHESKRTRAGERSGKR
jgi:hypothetical protein